MNYKKIFTGIMAVALIATICVGLSSCSEDDNKNPEADNGKDIMGRWINCFRFNQAIRSFIVFNENSAFSYETPKLGSGNGNFSISGILINQKIEFDNKVYDAKLYKMNVSGNSDFNQIWVYRFIGSTGSIYIAVEFYFNNELFETEYYGRPDEPPLVF